MRRGATADELIPEDKLAVSRAHKIQRFLGQPFLVAATSEFTTMAAQLTAIQTLREK
jgi:F0F1-type ATP synthase beta subunit